MSESSQEHLNQANESDKHIYDEPLHVLAHQHRKSLQQQSPSSFNQPVISRMMMVYISVSLLLILLLLGIIFLLTAVILSKMTTTTVPDPVQLSNQIESNISQLVLAFHNQIQSNVSQLVLAFHQQQNMFVNQIQSNVSQLGHQQYMFKKYVESNISQLAAAFNQKNDILNEVGKNNSEAIKNLQNKFNSIDNSCLNSLCPLPTSCQEINNQQPNSPSGVYLLAISNNMTTYVYCHMEKLCNSTVWRRIAYLDMRNDNENCPSGFEQYSSSNGVRACGRPTTIGPSCVGTIFPSNSIGYTEVCGKVIGYQVGWTDGSHVSQGNDRVLLTYGNNHELIWQFLAGTCKNSIFSNCPCGVAGDDRHFAVSVGPDYYCESGVSVCPPISGTFYSNERLWDGRNCGSEENACCERPGIPWFHKSLRSSIADDMEMSVCLSQSTSDEDIAVEQYEIYVK